MRQEWLYGKLTTLPPLTTLVPAERIRGGGSLTNVPFDRPFILIRYMPSTIEIRDDGKPVSDKEVVQFWVYDEPGSYRTIVEALKVIQREIPGPVQDAQWQGHVDWNGLGPELFDNELKAITRWGSATLVGSDL